VTVGGRHIDDTAASLSQHYAQLILYTQQRAEDVSVEGGGVAFSGLIRYRAGNTLRARVVNCHIQEAFYSPVD